MIKVVSFSTDGSVFDKKPFDNVFWYKEIPQEYSRFFKISVEKAADAVSKAYREVSMLDPEWHKPEAWFKKLSFKPDEERLLKSLRESYTAFRDAKPVIEKIYASHRYKLVAITNYSKSLLTYKLKTLGIQGVFHRVFAAVDDHNSIKLDPGVFREMLSLFQVQPHEFLHVGDDPVFDRDIPKALGMHALLLDRKGSDLNAIASLSEVLDYLKSSSAVRK